MATKNKSLNLSKSFKQKLSKKLKVSHAKMKQRGSIILPTGKQRVMVSLSLDIDDIAALQHAEMIDLSKPEGVRTTLVTCYKKWEDEIRSHSFYVGGDVLYQDPTLNEGQIACDTFLYGTNLDWHFQTFAGYLAPNPDQVKSGIKDTHYCLEFVWMPDVFTTEEMAEQGLFVDGLRVVISTCVGKHRYVFWLAFNTNNPRWMTLTKNDPTKFPKTIRNDIAEQQVRKIDPIRQKAHFDKIEIAKTFEGGYSHNEKA